MTRRFTLIATSLFLLDGFVNLGFAAEPTFKMEQIEAGLTVGYAVELVDANADQKPDIVVVDSGRVVWYENPTWKRHTLIEGGTKPDNVCLASYDVDGDGQLDFALGADWKPFNTKAGGTLQWLRRGKEATEPCAVLPIAEEPTMHRIRWVDLDGDGRKELIAAPLMGRNSTKEQNWSEAAVRILAFQVPANPTQDRWPMTVLNNDLHVCHNLWPADLNRDGKPELLVVSYEGVSLLERQSDGSYQRTLIGQGNQETSPSKGASEIKAGWLAGNKPYIATIEPWHGNQVVVYTAPATGHKLWTRHVLDEALKWGHGVWCANVDDDADEELIIGVRDDLSAADRCGVRIYDPANAAEGKWTRSLVDVGGVAVEDLAALDLNSDGRTDIVAAGRATKNVRIYWNVR